MAWVENNNNNNLRVCTFFRTCRHSSLFFHLQNVHAATSTVLIGALYCRYVLKQFKCWCSFVFVVAYSFIYFTFYGVWCMVYTENCVLIHILNIECELKLQLLCWLLLLLLFILVLNQIERKFTHVVWLFS